MKASRILIAGEGGQGVQALAKILTAAAFSQGKKVTFLPNFGVEQRGGVSLAFIQISDEEIAFPKFQKADFVVLLSPRAVKRIAEYFEKDSILLFDNSLVSAQELAGYHLEKIAIPASYLAKQKLIPKVFNTIILGSLVAELGTIKLKYLEKEVERYFADKLRKEPQLKHFNLRALEIGMGMVTDLKKEAKWRKKLVKA